ncbi:porin family protein [Pontibacter silvestris]|uniref:Porin family protein n=1 Tax=Pontibacter silvestris TaxID=2305183 RepID=A0ABW4WUT7_9BACT|nr:porin family protein [Pontibacter silvestris]MCC9136482.1 PorT family protein [Pontibacter silvestris]
MKKTLLLFAFALLTAFAAQAQRIGIRGGANIASFEGDDSEDFESRWGFHAGLTANFPIVPEFFSIQPEVLYSQKGASYNDDLFKVRVDYLDVPVLARINAGPIYFEAGPQVSFRINDKVEVSPTGSTSIDFDDIDNLRRTSVGYAAGLGLTSVPMGLSLGVRYNGDFSKLYDDGDNSADVRNSVFLLTLGFTLPTR